MSNSGEDKSAKTEKATAKRLEDARKKGDQAKSQDVSVWFVLLGCLVCLSIIGPLLRQISRPLSAFIAHPHAILIDRADAQTLMTAVISSVAVPMMLILGMIALCALTGHLVQAMPVWTSAKMAPKLDKISPIKGFGRLFGAQGWMNLLKAFLKLAAIGAAIAFALWPQRTAAELAGFLSVEVLISSIHAIAMRMMIAALVAIGLIAALDFFWQKHSFMQRMRMSRQDIKDETRQSEGDPLVRSRLRAIRQERGRRRMMAAVAEASVVITNPTHYSVALKYDAETTPVPICVAKGVDLVAQRIRETAEQARVPIVENPPLARTLHASVDIDRPIAVHHYEAVAKVIGYVMQMAKRRR